MKSRQFPSLNEGKDLYGSRGFGRNEVKIKFKGGIQVQVYKDKWITTETVCLPRKNIRLSNGHVGSYALVDTSYEKTAKVIQVDCVELITLIISEGTYMEPPEYDIDIVGSLRIRPIMNCWGKGRK